jgi:hypothetical protein
MAEEKKAITETSTLDEMKAFMKLWMEANRESNTDLAMKIANPEPTAAQREARLKTLADRTAQAAVNEAAKDFKRKHCMSPADPHHPHMRTGQQWQNWNRTPVIAWMYTYMTEKTPTGSRNIGPYAFGVCQWCGSEFKPGDADYEWAMSLGAGMSVGTYGMNQNTGVWLNG